MSEEEREAGNGTGGTEGTDGTGVGMGGGTEAGEPTAAQILEHLQGAGEGELNVAALARKTEAGAAEEKKQKEAEAEEAAADPEGDELPEVMRDASEKQKREFIRLRRERAKFKREADELRKKGTEGTEGSGTGGTQGTVGDGGTGRYGAAEHAKALQLLARANRVLASGRDEEGVGPERAAELKRVALEAVRTLTPEELVAAMDVVRAGGGDLAEEAADLARLELEPAKVRVAERERERTAQDAERTQRAEQSVSSMKERIASYGDLLKDPEGEAAQYVKEYFARKLGTVQKPGPYYAAALSDAATMAGLVDEAVLMWRGSKAAKTEEALKTRERQMERIRGPLGAGGAAQNGGGGGGRESDAIKREIAQKFGHIEGM